MKLNFVAAVPLVFSIVGFVLVTLATFAGRQKGFMEDYAVVRLNMSGFGKDMIQTDSGSSDDNNEDEDDGSIFDKVKDFGKDALDKAKDELNDIANDVADKLTEAIGISEWYSIHLMDSCEGGFTPDATSPSPGLNITNCTSPTVGYKINLTEIVDRELEVGPFNLNLADVEWPESIQKNIDRINGLLMAVTIFYLIGMGLSGLCMLIATADLLVGGGSYFPVLVGFVVSSLAALAIGIGAAVTTSAAMAGAKEITDVGEEVGVYANAGTKFVILSWVAFGVMLLAAVYWMVGMCKYRRAMKKVYPEKGERKRWRI